MKSSNKLNELITKIAEMGYSLDEVALNWKKQEIDLAREKKIEWLDSLREKYKKEYLGKYILSTCNSNIEIKPGFTKEINIEDLIPHVNVKIVKVTRVSILPKDLLSSSDYLLSLSGPSVVFNILGNRSEIDGDPLECFETSVSYQSSQFAGSSEECLLDENGEVNKYSKKIMILDDSLLQEILEYYKDSQLFSLDFIKRKLE